MIVSRSRFGLVLLVSALTMLAATATASASGSKLSVSSINSLPASAADGGSFGLKGKIVNRGASPSSARVTVTLLRAGQKPRTIGARRIARVKAHGKRSFRLRVHVPKSLSKGSYDVVACTQRGAGQSASACATAQRKVTVADAAVADPGPSQAQLVQAAKATSCEGTRTLGDRDFPEVGNGGFDITNYDVNLNYTPADIGGNVFNPGTHTLVTATSLQDLCKFSLDFDGLNIDSVTVNGVPATWTREAPTGTAPACTSTGCSNQTTPVYPPADGCSPSFRNPGTNHTGCPNMKLVITPASTIPNGAQFKVDVAYSGVPLRHLDADGTEEGWLNTPNNDGAFIVNEPIGAMTWLPSNNTPADKATFDFHITVPSNKIALGNGELVSYVQNGDGTVTWNWRMAYPMATYLSTATVGNFLLTEKIAENGLQIYNAYDGTFTTTQVNTANRTVDQLESIVNYLTTIYGTFPFDSHGVMADAAGSIGYVLEVQTKIAFPSSGISLSTLVHETGHQWWGDSVSLGQWNEIWQNEGWATYTASNYTAKNGGTSLQSVFNSNYTAGTKWNVAPVDVDAKNLFTTFPVYTRGSMMLIALQQILGNSKFYQLARTWQTNFGHGNARTTQFISLAKSISGFSGERLDKLDTFFQQWLYGRSMPTITGTNF